METNTWKLSRVCTLEAVYHHRKLNFTATFYKNVQNTYSELKLKRQDFEKLIKSLPRILKSALEIKSLIDNKLNLEKSPNPKVRLPFSDYYVAALDARIDIEDNESVEICICPYMTIKKSRHFPLREKGITLSLEEFLIFNQIHTFVSDFHSCQLKSTKVFNMNDRNDLAAAENFLFEFYEFAPGGRTHLILENDVAKEHASQHPQPVSASVRPSNWLTHQPSSFKEYDLKGVEERREEEKEEEEVEEEEEEEKRERSTLEKEEEEEEEEEEGEEEQRRRRKNVTFHEDQLNKDFEKLYWNVLNND